MPLTTVPSQGPDHRPDLVGRKLIAQDLNDLRVFELTYVRTISAFSYTALVLDVTDR